jgi:hypothetical protein
VRQIKKNNTVHNTKTVQPQSLMQQGVVRFCTVFSERSALIEKIADECYLQEEDERYAEDEFQMLCLVAEKLHGNKCACAAAERQNQQHHFRHTPAMQLGEGFIRTVDDKGGAVDEDQVII